MLKKVLALALAGAMVLGSMSFSAFAEEAAKKTNKITISGLEDGDTVKLYKVLAWTDDAADAETKLAVNGWYWVAPFSSTFNKDTNNDKMEDTLYGAVDENNKLQISSGFAGNIARALNENGTDTPVNTKTVGSNKTYEYSFAEIAEDATTNDGLYMAIVTPKTTDHVYNPIFVHLDSNTTEDSFTVTMDESYTEAVMAAKKSEVKVDKDSKSEDDYTDTCEGKETEDLVGQEVEDDEDGDLGKTVKPGDILDFTVKTVIPAFADVYKKPVFNVSDTMHDLIYQKNVKVYKVVDDEKVEIDASNYTITKEADDGYKIEFKDTYLKTIVAAQPIILEYTAKVPDTVSADDAANVTREKNTVVLEFSHDPSTESDQGDGGKKKYEKDITNHYTFAIDANALWQGNKKEEGPGHSGSEIIKVGVDKDGNPITESRATAVFPWEGENVTVEGTLAGAEFMLYKAKKNATSGELEIDETAPVFPSNIVTDNEGRMNMTGLDAGTYFLKEIKAPAGFVKSSDVVRIDIDATFRMQKYTEYYDQAGNWYTEDGTGRTKYEYEAKELASYTIKYNNVVASEHTFNHVEESNPNEAKLSSDVSECVELPHSIRNTKGVELPSTGGIGTTIFYAGGAVLVLLAGVLLVSKRRIA